MGENKQPKVMKNNQPISTKAKDKKVSVKKTCNDFLKDGCISSLQKPPQKDGGGRVDSDDVPSGSNKQSELKGSKEEVAVSKDVKKPKVTATPDVASQEVVEEEEAEFTRSGDQGESAPSPSALQTPSVQEAENEMEITVGNEVTEALSRMLLGKSTNRQMIAWIESNLDKRQRESAQFVRALVTSVCQAAISATSGSVHHVNACDLMERSEVLRKYLSDGQKELEALHALEDLLERMERPHKVLHLLFDVLFDEGIIKEDTFHECKGAAEQSGRGLVLQSVTDFFDWLSK